MDKNKERMEREKVITLLRLVKENGLKIDIAADEICSLFNVVGQSEQLSISDFRVGFGNGKEITDKELKEQREQGKKFAIICVNEILENIEATKLFHKESKSLPLNEKYWLVVKEAINSL